MVFGEDFGFCFMSDGTVLEKFEEGGDVVLFMFEKIPLVAV